MTPVIKESTLVYNVIDSIINVFNNLNERLYMKFNKIVTLSVLLFANTFSPLAAQATKNDDRTATTEKNVETFDDVKNIMVALITMAIGIKMLIPYSTFLQRITNLDLRKKFEKFSEHMHSLGEDGSSISVVIKLVRKHFGLQATKTVTTVALAHKDELLAKKNEIAPRIESWYEGTEK